LTFADPAAVQAASWALQSPTLVPGRVPALAAFAQLVFWMEQER
jgi:hypothetical protein